MTSAVYLYAVAQNLDPDELRTVTGVSATPVRTVGQAGLTAVVSTVPLSEYGAEALRNNLEDLAWLERTARDHHDVVAATVRHAVTAPVRLATVFHDDQRVRELLQERGTGISQALARVAGCAEWGVKIYGEPRPRAEPEPEEVGQSPGTAYLRRRGRQRRGNEDAVRAMAERAEEIHGTLAAHAVAIRFHRPQDPKLSGHQGMMLRNTAYLVEDGDAFTAALGRLDAGSDGLRIEITGPWPSYSFATLEAE
jgi:hypothetical protein